MFPLFSLYSNKTSVKDIPEDFSHLFFFVKSHDLFSTHDLFQNINIHDDNAGLIEHIGDKNVNIRIDMLVSIEGIILLDLVFSELVVKSDPERLVR